MIDWIKNTIDPPGIEKPNRGAIFKTIGNIMSRMRADAIKAYNAHFPYLADDKKLEEHGRALSIPHLINDKPDEFRNRVTAASFFLMKAGERGFILDLLKERFGDRFRVVENFLRLKIKIVGLTDEEITWVFALLDSLIDPNVSLDIAAWYHFKEKMIVRECEPKIKVKTKAVDFFVSPPAYYDGTYCYDGTIHYGSGVMADYFGIKTTEAPMTEKITMREKSKCGFRQHLFYDGAYCYDGTISYNSGVYIPLNAEG